VWWWFFYPVCGGHCTQVRRKEGGNIPRKIRSDKTVGKVEEDLGLTTGTIGIRMAEIPGLTSNLEQ